MAAVAGLVVAVAIPLSPLGDVLGFAALPAAFWLLLVVVVAAYLGLVELAKRRFEPQPRERAGPTRARAGEAGVVAQRQEARE